MQKTRPPGQTHFRPHSDPPLTKGREKGRGLIDGSARRKLRIQQIRDQSCPARLVGRTDAAPAVAVKIFVK